MGIRLTSRRVLAGYAAWMALLVVAHYTLAWQRTGTAALIELSGVAAMVAGVYINRPARRTPWLLLAAANLTGTVGEVASRVYATVTHAPMPFPSFADVIYLAAYPLYVAGLAMFIRSRSTGRDARSMIDALVLMVGLIVLSWVFLVMPDATAASLTLPQRVVSVAYPVADLFVLVTLARLLTPGTARGPSTVLLAFGTVCGVASDVAYDVLRTPVAARPAAPARLPGQRHRLGSGGAAPVDGRVDQDGRAAGPRRRSRQRAGAHARVADPARLPALALVPTARQGCR